MLYFILVYFSIQYKSFVWLLHDLLNPTTEVYLLSSGKQAVRTIPFTFTARSISIIAISLLYVYVWKFSCITTDLMRRIMAFLSNFVRSLSTRTSLILLLSNLEFINTVTETLKIQIFQWRFIRKREEHFNLIAVS